MDKLTRHHPAAFINVIAEEGSKAEAIKHLQETWNDYCELKRENERLRIALVEAENFLGRYGNGGMSEGLRCDVLAVVRKALSNKDSAHE